MRILGWIIILLILLDALGITLVLLRDGGREEEVWFLFLTLPLLIAGLAIVYGLLRLFARR